ncbi:hypothetical protein WJX73_009927 [Symbiochloris irregularis]|uniref:Uncharacterized protein n=1 Tax=Symbiochloris irregularis TaxID=706552 RepID=A0AAW1P0B8_9CHLO
MAMHTRHLELPLLRIVSVIAWVALFSVALFDAVKHRRVKRRGWQLQRALVAVVGGYVVQDVLLLAFVAVNNRNGSGAPAVCGTYVFFTDFADTAMIALLLTIAAGFCITRDTLGPYKRKVVLIPVVYITTTLLVDYTLFYIYGKGICESGLGAPEDPQSARALSEWWWVIGNFASLISLATLILAGLYILDTAQRERASLDPAKEGIVGAQVSPDVEIGAYNRSIATANANGGEAVGHEVNRPIADTEVVPGNRMPDVYAEMNAEDTDATKTVQDKVLTRSKLALMRQFQIGVGVYFSLLILVYVVLPMLLLNPNAPEQDNAVISIAILLQNVVLWAFLVALCFIFRLREDNPYLMLEEDDSPSLPHNAQVDTSLGEVRDVRTELGVLSSSDLDTPPSRGGGFKRGTSPTRGGGNDSPASVDRNFTLGDGDDEAHATQTNTHARPSQSGNTARRISRVGGSGHPG